MADKTTATARTFVKEVGGETRTRTVLTPQDEVNALYDGFVEQKTSRNSPTSGSSRPSGSSSS